MPSSILKLSVVFFMFIASSHLLAADISKDKKNILVNCHPTDCVDAIKDLDTNEQEQIIEIVKKIKFGLDETQISKYYPKIPNTSTPPKHEYGQQPNDVSHMASFYLVQQESLTSPIAGMTTSHMDVLFVNGGATLLKVWSNRMWHCVFIYLNK
ncbi:hypothetical protein [Solimicrobium silvestre]|uniref:Uncharacterized protein n=1 Tax=Solimicrobium silvestre TaxID=2099400 RepID=A0A2S9GS94_9BURK|nr:hypothetical protein [Solimicrobium silvestre]PRC90566.1 hypothetical protein S2091_4725 [Solimicrobium silvestre]